MDNFLNYITKNLDPEQVDIWFRVNNIIPERMDLYYDLSYSLFLLIKTTYLGYDDEYSETKVKMTNEDNQNHFDWCWDKIIENFRKENIKFNERGEHYDYFLNLFNRDKSFTQVDLDLVFNIYKSLDKNVVL